MNRHTPVTVLMASLLIGALLLPSIALAANDPGHDSLYVLRMGDTNITGSINISANVTATFVRFTSKAFGDYLDIIANGTVLGAPSTPRIMGATSSLYIDSTGGLYLNTKGGTSSTIQIGDTATNGVTLNVSGVIRQQNVLVCLSNGSNCISGTNGGNVTTVTAGSGIANSGTATDPVLDVNVGDGLSISVDALVINNASVCRSDGTGCPAASGASGWLNNSGSGNISLANSAVNVSINTLFIDNTNGRVGIGTATPTGKLQVAGQLNVTAGNLSVQQGNGVCFNTACTSRIYYNGTATIIEGA